nr:MAG TPA: hypothetical protein [Bacteriophage sp.]
MVFVKSYKIFRENLYIIYLRQNLPKQIVKVTKLLQFWSNQNST